MNKNTQQLDTKTIQSMTAQVLMSIKASPNANVGPALAFGTAKSVEEAVRLYIMEHWHDHLNHYPETQQDKDMLTGRISLFINQTMTSYYGDYSWQHVPEYPGL